MIRRLLPLLVALFFMVPFSASAQDEATIAKVEAHFMSGAELFKAAKYDLSIKEFD